jgi:hypothetical protein
MLLDVWFLLGVPCHQCVFTILKMLCPHSQQVSDIVSQLFSHLSPSRLTTFSCGHIIPTSNLHTLVISQGPQGKELEFKYSQQGDHALVSGFRPAYDEVC